MRLLKNYIFSYWKFLITPILGMFITLGIDAALPILQQVFIDDILLGDDTHLLLNFALIFLGLTLLRCTFGYIKEYGFDKFALDVTKTLRTDIFSKIQSLEFSFFDKTNTGELMSRIGEDADLVWETLGFGLRLFIELVITFGICSVLMFHMSPTLAFFCLILLIPVSLMSFFFEKKFWEVYTAISDQTAKLNSVAQQNIAGIRLVKAFAREKHEIMKFLDTNQALYDLNLRQARLTSRFVPLIEFFCNLSNVSLIIVGGLLCMNGQATLGVLVAFSQYILQLTWCVKNLGTFITMLSQNKACMSRIFKILDTPATITSPVDCYRPECVKGDITFNHVSFSYNDTPILTNINLTIPSGSSVAIMGATGCGKSTLLALIGRYYDVTEGEILVDGVNVKSWDLHILRKHLSVVFQEPFLFSDTIKNNIDFGETHDLEAIQEAADLSCSHDFIASLPEGFMTTIGERGVGLSGGQKQRLTIARALLQTPSILVLDDATSALDMETEYTVLRNLATRAHTCTTFIVAHRISGVKDADLILYMEAGRIVEQGSHHTLLAQKGHYYAIYCDQFKDFITLEEAN